MKRDYSIQVRRDGKTVPDWQTAARPAIFTFGPFR